MGVTSALLLLLSASLSVPSVVDCAGTPTRLARAREKARLLRSQAEARQTSHAPERTEPRDDDAIVEELELDCGKPDGRYVSSLPAIGMHVITAPGPDTCSGGARVTALSVYVDGLDSAALTLPVSCSSGVGSVEEWLLTALRRHAPAQRDAQMGMLLDSGRMAGAAVEIIMAMQHPPPKRTWRLFTAYGTPLATPGAVVNALQTCGTVLCFEGGSFMWPGVEVGHVHTLRAGAGAEAVTLTTLSLQPLAFSVERLLSDEDCEWIIESSKPELARAVIVKTGAAKSSTACVAQCVAAAFFPCAHRQKSQLTRGRAMPCVVMCAPPPVSTTRARLRSQRGARFSRRHSHACKPLRRRRTGCFVFRRRLARRGCR